MSPPRSLPLPSPPAFVPPRRLFSPDSDDVDVVVPPAAFVSLPASSLDGAGDSAFKEAPPPLPSDALLSPRHEEGGYQRGAFWDDQPPPLPPPPQQQQQAHRRAAGSPSRCALVGCLLTNSCPCWPRPLPNYTTGLWFVLCKTESYPKHATSTYIWFAMLVTSTGKGQLQRQSHQEVLRSRLGKAHHPCLDSTSVHAVMITACM